MKTPVLIAAAVFVSPNAAAATQVGSNGYFVGTPHEQEELWQGGKQIRERSVYQQYNCNGRAFFIHTYPDRHQYRTILPPDWGHAIGGRDFDDRQEAMQAACKYCREGVTSGGCPDTAGQVERR